MDRYLGIDDFAPASRRPTRPAKVSTGRGRGVTNNMKRKQEKVQPPLTVLDHYLRLAERRSRRKEGAFLITLYTADWIQLAQDGVQAIRPKLTRVVLGALLSLPVKTNRGSALFLIQPRQGVVEIFDPSNIISEEEKHLALLVGKAVQRRLRTPPITSDWMFPQVRSPDLWCEGEEGQAMICWLLNRRLFQLPVEPPYPVPRVQLMALRSEIERGTLRNPRHAAEEEKLRATATPLARASASPKPVTHFGFLNIARLAPLRSPPPQCTPTTTLRLNMKS